MTVRQLARERAPGFLVRGLDSLEDRYEDTLARVLDRPLIGLLASALSLLVLSLLLWNAGRGSVPAAGPVGRPIRIEVRGPDATTLAGVTRRVADEIREVRGAVDVTCERSGDHRTRIEAGIYARNVRAVHMEIASVLADLALPPGYALAVSSIGVDRWSAVARLGGILLALIAGMVQGAAMIRIDNRRRARGDSARVAAVVAARRRFSPNVLSTGILIAVAGLFVLAGSAAATSFAVSAVTSLSVVLLLLLFAVPSACSLRTAVAR